MKYEILWALANVGSGNSTQANALIFNDYIKKTIHYLSSQNIKLKEQAYWALGNIAADGIDAKTHLLNEGIYPVVFEDLRKVNSNTT
mmetsp:Transcript_25898/g.22936  ORF Transcript_25898/g.22936 Transcript_25898/m.22936 type:complete len:87 (+) Transcript_25898:388-648(+)